MAILRRPSPRNVTITRAESFCTTRFSFRTKTDFAIEANYWLRWWPVYPNMFFACKQLEI